jgi:ABC-2 type transport system ATP-binding protein
MDLIQIHNVSKHYRNHTALDQVSFNVPKGSIFGLLGPNGAGKTSLIRIINQITAPDSGHILFNGEPLQSDHIKRIGYLPEERGLYKKMSVFDQLMYFAQLKGLSKKEAGRTIYQWLEKFEALDWHSKKIEELSKGMQQKIQFIITVLHQPDFLILDEPFTGFDPKNTQLIKDEIKRLQSEGATIMLSTHRMESVEEICDQVVMINHSKLIAEGKVNELRESLKQNLFELIYEGSAPADAIEDIEVVKQESSQIGNRLVFRFKPGIAPNIQSFSHHGFQVKEYREIIPSMQEVFITLTEEAS